jgi:hypothetical protein
MPTITPDDVATYLGRSLSTVQYDQCEAVINVVKSEVFAFTRGIGFDQTGNPNPELWSLIQAVSAQRFGNPLGVVREEMGGLMVQHAPSGFTLPQQMVLNRYRKRAT